MAFFLNYKIMCWKVHFGCSFNIEFNCEIRQKCQVEYKSEAAK